ncbi:NaeI family type II restriction endonuclease [Planctobacterium marinum]|uniref:NaeI family type II restriction endonuclease n=1 Tax=Planctobacterium marinum TaxID=1631968 RepID=UPI001E4B5E6F|nr:NaeI family type II restriction endonuclease [Planctobacterium marinum]MCC2606811.1 hypothetical protein [Planctobacterium marinum]
MDSNNNIIKDKELDSVYKWFISQTNYESRLIDAIRKAIDEVIDGPRTGRFTYKQLEKTEKTYLGTKVEILLRAEFGLSKGEDMDYQVNGIEVDCKYTGHTWGWSIPREAMGHICLLVRADDEKGTASVGLIRISEEVLNKGKNQDGKRTISKAGRGEILWLIDDGKMSINQLFIWSQDVIEQIWSKESGQQRLNELFRLKQGELIDRQTIATVAEAKDDPMKRVRANGGARSYLSKEGIIILGHQNDHPRICQDLGLEIPNKGQVISIRIVNDKNGPLDLAGEKWRVAYLSDPINPAPAAY